MPVRPKNPLLRDLPPEVAALSAVAFCVALGFGIMSPAIPIFAKSFGVTAFAATAVISAFALMRFISSPFSGWLAGQWGERLTVGIGLAIVSVSSLLAGFATDFVQLIIMRGVGGIGSSMFSVGAQALILRVVEPSQRGRSSAAYQGGFLFGGIAGPAVGGAVLAISLRMPFFVYAATLALAVVVTFVFLHPKRLARLNAGTADETPMQKSGWPEFKLALRDRSYIAALGSSFTSGMVTFGIRAALVPLFVVEGLRQNASLAGWAFLLAAAAQAVLLLPVGRAVDNRGRRPVMIIGSAMLIVSMTLLVLSDLWSNDPEHSIWPAIILFLLSMAIGGIANAFLGPAPAAVVGDVMGGKRGGITISAFQMMSDFGIIVGPLVAGALLDAFDFEWAFGLGVALSAVALLLAIWMNETLQRRAVPQ